MKGKFASLVLFIQIVFIVLFGVCVDYGQELDATRNAYLNASNPAESHLHHIYPFFQDVNVMIFVGVGFLYAFLRRYSYSGIGMNMLIAAISIQWSILCHNWWNTTDGKIHIDSFSLLSGEFAAASAVIAFGGIFGKVSPLQMVVFTLFEVFFYTINEHICVTQLQISDCGGSVSLHMFAGLFGCAAAFAVDFKMNVQDNRNEETSYKSNVFCMIGTVLLWVFWPSFNAAFLSGDQQYRCVMNTFLSLLASCLVAFAVSSLLHKENKFSPSHIQNATLAGGVAIGATADLMIRPFGALLIGSCAGTLSVCGYHYVTPFLARLKVYDPCGINSLHALPGLLGGITAIIATSIATEKHYGHSLYRIYPAMAPAFNTTELTNIHLYSPYVIPGLGRTLSGQTSYQVFYVLEAILAAVVTGALTGTLLRLKIFDPLEENAMFLDEPFWVLPQSKKENKGSELHSCNSTL